MVGFELEGQTSSVCQANESWSNPDPICRSKFLIFQAVAWLTLNVLNLLVCLGKECAIDYLSVENGNASCTIMNRFESVCTYICDSGYELAEDNATSASCGENQTWSRPKPTCSKIRCTSADASILRVRHLLEYVFVMLHFYITK